MEKISRGLLEKKEKYEKYKKIIRNLRMGKYEQANTIKKTKNNVKK
ncbi:MAG: hypothetical protein N4A47_03945 [Clostridia bacterium]|jgi:hypothetical protein|nr:hypothetical protein [Clostridia bacterium]